MMLTCKQNNGAGFGAFDACYDEWNVQGGMRQGNRDSFRDKLLLFVRNFCCWLRCCLALNC